jgi:uncharacterized protein (TIGR00251 family)
VDPRRTIVQDSKSGAILTVHVQPNASHTESAGLYGDALKIRVAARPIDGDANEELIRFIARQCAVSQASVAIQAGAGGRRKRVCVKGVTAETVWTRLMPAVRDGGVKT